jgi:Ca-activated chloride channel family protein
VPTPRVNWVLFGIYVLIAIAVFFAAVISPPVRAYARAPLRDLVLPAPKPVVVSVLYSTEKEEWITEAAERFQSTRPRVDGHPVQLELNKMGSREMYLAVLDGSQKPDMISPASMLQIALLQDLSTSVFGAPVVNRADSRTCRPVLKSPVVLVAWKERADVLWGQAPGDDLWFQLHEAVTHPGGWAALEHPEWGYVKFSHTDPLKSNSGFQTVLLMTYAYHGKTQGLTSADILSDADYQQWFTEFEGTISKFGDSTGTYMKEIIAYGPSLYDMVTVYEATMIEHAENAVGRYGELQVYYPPATSMSDHPFCILQNAGEADWVTPQKARAAQMFLEFLTSTEIQELALLEHGFRPVDPSISLDQAASPLQAYAANGLRIDLPPEVEVPSGDVLQTLLDFWSRNVQR